ncbi:replication protein P [Candidatus Symbiopectobacterium sp. NZEC127]|uniref:replication protein P n=1 Tax=Candidatus Symbiopectobacterium sp. NZEC127 TaxID=2820472 RepID=UPI0039B4D3FD
MQSKNTQPNRTPLEKSAQHVKPGKESDRVWNLWETMGEIYSNRWTAKNGLTPTNLWIAQVGALSDQDLARICSLCAERCSQGKIWPPDLGEFMALTVESGANPFGVNVADVLAEYKRWRNESYRYSSSTEFPWRQPVLYHICIEMRRASVEKRMTARELERLAERLLTKWIKHAGNGLSVPPVRRQLTVSKHSSGPTPAQQMYQEYLRKKASGLI